MIRSYLLSLTAAALSIVLETVGTSAPTVPPGFAVEKYVDIALPAGIDVDSLGNLYVGNGEPGFTPVRIRMVSPDRTVTEIGDPIADPDAVIVDEQGDVVGAGNVIVGADLNFVEVNPLTGATSTVYTGIPAHNVLQMAFDSLGRLFATHANGYMTVIDGGALLPFDEFPGHALRGIAIDENDQLYFGLGDLGQIHTFDLPSGGSSSLFTTFPATMVQFGYTDAPGPFSSTLFVGTANGEIYSVDLTSGDNVLFASGFGGEIGLAFGPDGSMFVSSSMDESIYRIFVPEPAGISLVVWGLSGCVGHDGGEYELLAARAECYRRNLGGNQCHLRWWMAVVVSFVPVAEDLKCSRITHDGLC